MSRNNKEKTEKPILLIKKPGCNLAYKFNLDDGKTNFVFKIMAGLPVKSKAKNAETLTKDDFFTSAGLILRDEHAYHLRRHPNNRSAVLEINIDPPLEKIEKARIFFETFFNLAYKLHEKDTNDAGSIKIRNMIAAAAKITDEKIEKQQNKEIAAEAVKEIIEKISERAPEDIIYRIAEPVTSKEMLDYLSSVMNSQSKKSNFFSVFGIKEPEQKAKDEIKNTTQKNHTIYSSAFDIDTDQSKIHFSASEANGEKLKAFLYYMNFELTSEEFKKAPNWEKAFDKAYAESVKYLELKNSGNVRKSSIHSNKKSLNDNEHYVEINWTQAIAADTPERSKYKKHFLTGRDGNHLVLTAESPYAKALHKALEKEKLLFKYIIGSGQGGCFDIREGKDGSKEFRFSREIPFAQERMNIFQAWMEGAIANIPQYLSMTKADADLKSLFKKIDEKVSLQEQEKKKNVDAAKIQEEQKQNHTVKIDKDVAPVFLEKLKKNIDKLKKAVNLDSISISGYEVSIGSKSSPVLGSRQQEIKELIEWMAKQTEEKTVAAIDKGNFKDPIIQFKREKDAAAIKAREASYTQFQIKGASLPTVMRNPEQIEANRTIQTNNLVCLIGEAGTGKTYLASAIAMYMLDNPVHKIEQIIITRPEVPLGNKKKGFLPGTDKEKLKPYFESYMENMRKIFKGSEKTFETLLNGSEQGKDGAKETKPPKIIIEDLSYIRGRTFDNTIVIVDECQDITKEEKAVIPRRIGTNSKLILCGDITDNQTDLPLEDRYTFKNFVLQIAYAQSKNEIIYNSEGGNALDMFAVVQMTKIERGPFTENIICFDRFCENYSDFKNENKMKEFEKSFIKEATVTVKKPKPS